jgi:hypothetical protein
MCQMNFQKWWDSSHCWQIVHLFPYFLTHRAIKYSPRTNELGENRPTIHFTERKSTATKTLRPVGGLSSSQAAQSGEYLIGGPGRLTVYGSGSAALGGWG